MSLEKYKRRGWRRIFGSLMIRFVLNTRKLIRKMSVFTQCMNPLTGNPSWEEKDQSYDYHQEVARSAFADMLHDHERNKKYYDAIKMAIEEKHRVGEDANVLDIGTGTGLLSMMAAKCGADTITACEAFAPMAKCAVKIIQENGFGERIKVVHKRSTEMTIGKDGDMIKRANILVTEVFDTELIGEGALPTFRHAHDILLEKNSIVVPSSGTVWVQVIESPEICAWNRVKQIKIGNDALVDVPACIKSCSGAGAVHDIQLTRFPTTAFRPLLPSQPIFRFDWTGREPLLYDEKVKLNVTPISNGTAHAIFMWWNLNMDTHGEIVLSCAPVWEHPETKKLKSKGLSMNEIADAIPWRDHWMQAVYYLPEDVSVTLGEEISLTGYHDSYSFWFQLEKNVTKNVTKCPRPICDCGVHVAHSRTRIGQLNDEKRNQKYIEALRKKIKPDSTCLCITDGCLLSLAAIKFGARKIFLLESNFLSRRTTEMFVKANGLTEKVEIIDSVDKLPPSDAVDLIFGEPYFIGSIVPWENLRFWYIVSKHYPTHIPRIPLSATIKAVAIEFKDLHKIRAPLGICEGFDLSSFDKLVQNASNKTDDLVEAQPLWEYPGRALTMPFDIATFDLRENVTEQPTMRLTNNVPILESGWCNGVAIWIDWKLDSDLTVSSGPIEDITPGKRVSWDPFTRQGVHLFRKISYVRNHDMLSWSLEFLPDSLNASIGFQFNILSNKCDVIT